MGKCFIIYVSECIGESVVILSRYSLEGIVECAIFTSHPGSDRQISVLHRYQCRYHLGQLERFDMVMSLFSRNTSHVDLPAINTERLVNTACSVD